MLKKLVAVAVLLLLVISALNISNQAINSLTMENRGPVLAINLEDSDISIYLLGENHVYSKDNLPAVIIQGSQYSRRIYEEVYDYLYKIWKISNIIFFDKYLWE